MGSSLVRKVLQKKWEAHILSRADGDLKNIKDLLGNITLHYGALEDFAKLKNIIEKIRPDGIFHLAASTLMQGRTAAEEEVINANVLGTLNLTKAARAIPNLKFFINTGTFLEFEAPEIYSATKLLNTKLVESLAKREEFPGITLLIFTPYGPYIQPGRLVRAVIENALKNEPIVLTNPSVTRDFIFVEDLADLYLVASEHAGQYKGKVFNAGTGVATSLAQLVECVLKLTSSKSEIKWGAFKAVGYDSERWQADISETLASFDWRPTHSLEKGISKTIEWIRKL